MTAYLKNGVVDLDSIGARTILDWFLYTILAEEHVCCFLMRREMLQSKVPMNELIRAMHQHTEQLCVAKCNCRKAHIPQNLVLFQ